MKNFPKRKVIDLVCQLVQVGEQDFYLKSWQHISISI